MRHLSRSLILALGAMLLPVAASAQVLTLATRFSGEVPAADEKLFREVIASEATSLWKGNAKNEAATAALLGDGAKCDDGKCAASAGAAVPASAAIAARVNDEADIFDFSVAVYSAVDGKVLVKEDGECTFCTMEAAAAEFRKTVKSAFSKVGTLPGPTAGKVVAAAPAPAPAPPAAPTPAPTPAPKVAASLAPAAPASASKSAASVAVAPAPAPAASARATPMEKLDAWMKGDKTVTIAATPSDALVRVNGQVLGAGRTTIKAGPQKLEIAVGAPGYTDFTEQLELLPEDPGLELRIALAYASAGGLDPEARQFRRSAGWVSTSLGIIGAITGAVLLGRDGEANCAGARSQCAEVYDLGAAGGLLSTAGGVALGAGLSLLLTTPVGP